MDRKIVIDAPIKRPTTDDDVEEEEEEDEVQEEPQSESPAKSERSVTAPLGSKADGGLRLSRFLGKGENLENQPRKYPLRAHPSYRRQYNRRDGESPSAVNRSRRGARYSRGGAYSTDESESTQSYQESDEDDDSGFASPLSRISRRGFVALFGTGIAAFLAAPLVDGFGDFASEQAGTSTGADGEESGSDDGSGVDGGSGSGGSDGTSDVGGASGGDDGGSGGDTTNDGTTYGGTNETGQTNDTQAGNEGANTTNPCGVNESGMESGNCTPIEESQG